MSSYNGKKGAFNISGLPGVSDVYQVTTTSETAGPKTFWDKWFKPHSNAFTSLITAEAALTGGINEVIMLSPESHALASMLTWDKSNSALIGQSPDDCRMNQRSRISMSANFATMITVSGDGNLFKNLYIPHGRGSATNVNCLTVSGDRNTFYNCHFAGPQNDTEADTSGYDLIRLTTAEETVFKKCFIGNMTIDSTAVNLVEKQTGSGAVLFDECIFYINSSGASNTILKLDTGIMARPIIFKDCIGIVAGTALTYAITGDFLGASTKAILCNTDFTGCTDVCSANNEGYVISMGGSAYRGADEVNSLGVPYDHTA
jgi:hypothetical protein